jgi:hypothetical protein
MKTSNESPKLPQDDNQSVEKVDRRRFLGAGTAAGVVLAVTGRSAMATGSITPTTRCLSPLAWVSLHPTTGATAQLSHTVSQTCTFGKSPGYWLPNCGGSANTFQGKWPCAPFSPKVIGLNNAPYYYADNSYLNARGVPGTDSGWRYGARLPFYRTDKSISRLLLDSPANGLEWHICAAYLNIRQFSGYPVTLDELEKLATGQPIGGRIFTTSEVKSFLDQTWL